MKKREGNNGNHGAKGRSGRKPGAFKLLKERIESEKQSDAEYAFSIYVSVMRDESQPLELRLDCADWVANRVLGKPNLQIGVKTDGKLQIEIIRESTVSFTNAASSPATDQERSEAV
jgi:hypothetical protein